MLGDGEMNKKLTGAKRPVECGVSKMNNGGVLVRRPDPGIVCPTVQRAINIPPPIYAAALPEVESPQKPMLNGMGSVIHGNWNGITTRLGTPCKYRDAEKPCSGASRAN